MRASLRPPQGHGDAGRSSLGYTSTSQLRHVSEGGSSRRATSSRGVARASTAELPDHSLQQAGHGRGRGSGAPRRAPRARPPTSSGIGGGTRSSRGAAWGNMPPVPRVIEAERLGILPRRGTTWRRSGLRVRPSPPPALRTSPGRTEQGVAGRSRRSGDLARRRAEQISRQADAALSSSVSSSLARRAGRPRWRPPRSRRPVRGAPRRDRPSPGSAHRCARWRCPSPWPRPRPCRGR
jgi:hypothetical protein